MAFPKSGKSFFVLFMITVVLHCKSVAFQCDSTLQQVIYKQLFVDQEYDKNFAPPSDDPSNPIPLDVTISMFIVDFVVDDNEPTKWTANMFFRSKWADSRLQYPDPSSSCPNFKSISLNNDDTVDDIWRPDLFFFGQYSSFYHDTPDRVNQYSKIYPDGTVIASKYISITSPCSTGPNYEVLCQIVPEMYGSVVEEINMVWRPTDPVGVDEERMKENSHLIGDIGTLTSTIVGTTGTHPLLIATFEIHKNPAYRKPSYGK